MEISKTEEEMVLKYFRKNPDDDAFDFSEWSGIDLERCLFIIGKMIDKKLLIEGWR